MTYTLRELKSTDLFLFANILNKVGISKFSTIDPKGKTPEILVFDMIDIVLGNLNNCKSEIYKFLSELTGLNVKELEEMPPAEFLQIIVDIKEKEEFKDFFKVASKLLK